ncbi:glycosyltransferase family 61 protein [Natronorubrum halophilum]|uniref:glycosyltransferase family 61 protein n=1 Tax=Natronorubrum halophilum TaxID=1702106 RepID=UPI0013CE79CD|nr:glycosyltransferase family 61 protein [Natronorubrum halophilum]
MTEDGNLITDTIARPENTVRRITIGIGSLAAENGVRQTRSTLFGTGPEPTRQVERASAILPLWNNYYHWTVECLPRLRSLEQYAAETGTRPTVFVPSDMSGWMLEWLSILGWETHIEPLPNETVEAEQLVVTSHPEPIPADCMWLRERGFEAADWDDDGSSSRRVYISRADATRRRVSNRSRLDPLLEEFGFESYVLGELTVAEQIGLFSEAEIVLAPHGAGLTNVVFGRDLSVVELFGPKKNTTFYRLSDLCGHEYRSLECPSDGLDIDVDLDVLRTVLEDVTA